jgi:hypothetical protein
MQKRLLYLIVFFVLLMDSCSSGKKALKHGDYYDAVLQAVNRLRQNPDHKKSKEVLSLSYQMAVDYLETDAKNEMASNSNFKWKATVQNYDRINVLYEQIRTSPGAKKVIPNPVNRYKELAEAKTKAAEETYEAGIQAMLKNTREDAKNAYFLFVETNGYSPGYRETIEMMEQSKFNATLKVVVEPGVSNLYDWSFEPVVFGFRDNQFVKFYTPAEAQEQRLQKIDQFIRITYNGYSETRPSITKRVDNFKDSVKTGEKTVNNVKVPIYEKVSAQMTNYEKTITSRGSIMLYIEDGLNKAVLKNTEVIDEERWSDKWATCSGDQRALSDGNKKLCAAKEPTMPRNTLVNQTKKGLDNKLANALSAFYRNY